MKKYLKILLCCCGIFCAVNVYAWSGNGHRIVAAIAYANLTPQAKREVNRLTTVNFSSTYALDRLLQAATWPDSIKAQGVTAFNPWHYLDAPYSVDGVKGRPAPKQNVAWAIQQSIKVLHSKRAHLPMKALFLNFLVHFVGDVHQPLHCIDRFSKQFPHGDVGGNLFKIQAFGVNNLHSYWDKGAGLFVTPYKMNYKQVQSWAKRIMKEYPKSYFGDRVNDLDPYTWAKNSYQLAIKDAYTGIKPGDHPSEQYQSNAQQVVKQQIALAGYRLANILNNTL